MHGRLTFNINETKMKDGDRVRSNLYTARSCWSITIAASVPLRNCSLNLKDGSFFGDVFLTLNSESEL